MNDESYLIWGMALLIAALIMVFLEAVVPTAGILALAGAAVAIGGIVCLFNVGIVWGILGIAAFLVLGGGGFMFALSVMPNLRFGRRLIHGDAADNLPEEGAPTPESLEAAELAKLRGKEGETLTDMRPVGAVIINNTRYQAISEVAYIRRGTRVRVTTVEDNQIKVRPVA